MSRGENKIIPLSEDHIRTEIRLAMEKTGARFELYELRSLFVSWMLLERKVSGENSIRRSGKSSTSRDHTKTLLRRLNRETLKSSMMRTHLRYYKRVGILIAEYKVSSEDKIIDL